MSNWTIRGRLQYLFYKLYEPIAFSDGETTVKVEKWSEYGGPPEPEEFIISLTSHSGDTIIKARTRTDSPRQVQVSPVGGGRYRDPTYVELAELRLRVGELYDAVSSVNRETTELTDKTRCYEFVHKHGYEKLGRVVNNHNYDEDENERKRRYENWKREEGY